MYNNIARPCSAWRRKMFFAGEVILTCGCTCDTTASESWFLSQKIFTSQNLGGAAPASYAPVGGSSSPPPQF